MSVHLIRFRIEAEEKYPNNYDERRSFWLNQYREYINLPYTEQKKREYVWENYYKKVKESISYARFKRMRKLFKQKDYEGEFKQLAKEAREAIKDYQDKDMPNFIDPEEVMRKSWVYRKDKKSKNTNDDIKAIFQT